MAPFLTQQGVVVPLSVPVKQSQSLTVDGAVAIGVGIGVRRSPAG
jgi:hypothetical protein